MISEKGYAMISAFESEILPDKEWADWEIFKKVMTKFTDDIDDISSFWASR